MEIKRYTQEEFIKNNVVYSICEDIYLGKYFLEDDFKMENMSNLTFFTYNLDNKIIGFGSYQDNEYLFIVETIFIDEYKYSEHQKLLLNEILNEISLKNNEINVCAYQSIDEDYTFYINNGFELYKDYGLFFDIGLDNTRYVLNYSKNIYQNGI